MHEKIDLRVFPYMYVSIISLCSRKVTSKEGSSKVLIISQWNLAIKEGEGSQKSGKSITDKRLTVFKYPFTKMDFLMSPKYILFVKT